MIKHAIQSVIMSLGICSFASFADADVIAEHPNHDALTAAFASAAPSGFAPTTVTRASYLKLIAGNIDFFKTCQNDAGAIIDPVSRGERQYSTPAFALAAAVLVKEAGRDDLKQPAIRAFHHALTSLVNGTPADKHADFFIPLLVHAYRLLKDVAPPEQAQGWAADFAKLDPAKSYRSDLRGMNWNVVSSSGELLRQKDGLVNPQLRAAQRAYIDESLAGHLKAVAPVGLFKDPGVPLAYDAFSRLWLEDLFADGAYDGELAEKFEHLMRLGGLSTLLMLSPTGEWPTGGRSSMHNWTDLQVVAICEMNAVYWQRQQRPDVAGAFKRAAHLAFESAARWQRPSGELNIIKNRAEPQDRFAYEPYSNHSQYNLLPMAMLAIAYTRADESIAERPSVAEAGRYVFDLRTDFHKVFAAADGYYAEVDTAADPHYNATGLQRVHRAGVVLPMLNDSCAPDRGYGDKKAARSGLAVGLEWPNAAKAGEWLSLADFGGGDAKKKVKAVDLKVAGENASPLKFSLTYALTDGAAAASVSENYTIDANGVALESTVAGRNSGLMVQIPVQLNDGKDELKPTLSGNRVTMSQLGSNTAIEVADIAEGQSLTLTGERLQNHSGHVQAAKAPVNGGKLSVRITLSQDATPAAK